MATRAQGPESGSKHRKPMDAYPCGFLRDGSNGEGKGGGRQFTIGATEYSVPIDVRVGVRANINYRWLQPTRGVPEGRDEHGVKIEQAFREYRGDRIELLLNNPVQVVAVPQSLSVPGRQAGQPEAWDLIILDGNGRARWAPNFGIKDVPCNVQTVDQVTANFHRENHPEVTPTMVAEALKKEANKADASYVAAQERPIGGRRIHYTTPGDLSSDMLRQMLPGFPVAQQA